MCAFAADQTVSWEVLVLEDRGPSASRWPGWCRPGGWTARQPATPGPDRGSYPNPGLPLGVRSPRTSADLADLLARRAGRAVPLLFYLRLSPVAVVEGDG